MLKQVNNYGGGTKGPQDFTPDIDLIHGGSTYNNDHYGFPANGDMTITSGLNPGDRYQVHEELDPNYQVKYLDDCYGTIEAGKVKTCIVINTYIPKSSATSTSSESSTASTTQTTNSAQQNYLIPSWVRNNAKWWSQGQTSDSDFASGIGYLVTNKIIKADSRGTLGSTVVIPSNMQIPSWIKNDANYWAFGNIDDNTFLQGIQYMLDNNIITFSTHNTAKTGPVTNGNQQPQKVTIYFVDDETNAPVNALVTIGGGVTYMEKETERDGSISVSLRPGSYTITADADNYQRSTSTFEVKDSDLSTTISLKKLISASTEQTPQNTSPSQSSSPPSTAPQTTPPQTTPQVTPPTTPAPTTPPASTTTQTQLTVSISQTSAFFTHNIGSSPCPTPIAMVGLVSSQQGIWQVASAPSWVTVALNGNQAMIGFNCQLQSYTTQTLNGDVTFTFTSLDGQTASAIISITGQIHGQ